MMTLKQLEDAERWLSEQRAVVHPGPIETIREALSLVRATTARRVTLDGREAHPITGEPV